MPQINNLGSGGINFDTSPLLLAPNVFSNGKNIRFRNGSVETITGETTGLTLSSAVNFGVHWRRPDQSYNIFGKDGVFYRADSAGNISTMLNSSATKYTDSSWQSTYFNGGFAVVINNGKSTPLYCLYGDLNASNSFQELPNWNYLTNLTVTAKVIRSLNYSLVAANLTLNDNGTITNAPGTIRVSVQAPTGGIPQVWQPGLTTDTADEFELSSTSPILDMAELRGNMYVYSQDSISVLSIGQISTVKPYSKTYGILNTNCVTEFDGNHFVVDNNDIYVHNGSGKIESVAYGLVKDYFFSTLNSSKVSLVHVSKYKYYNEIWINYPTGSSNYCNQALIFNYKTNTWSLRTLPNITFAFNGPVNQNSLFNYTKDCLYLAKNTNGTLVTDNNYLMFDTVTNSLTSYESFVEKKKLNIGDLKGSNLITSVYPVFDSVPSETTLNISCKGQNNYTADVSYDAGDVFVFEPSNERSQGYKVDPRTNGRLMNLKISSNGHWRFVLYDLDIKPVDRR